MTKTLGFVFPGQGSQKTGMLAELAESYSSVGRTFSEASETLGYDLWALVCNGPDSELAKTHITQPALLAASIAIFRVWQEENGAMPALMAGHSLGEYSALVASGVIGFQDAIDLVRKRGEFMQTAVPIGEGGMSAIIGLDDAAVVKACEQASGDESVCAANFNSPGQVVIAGHAAAVERANVLCKEAGAKRALPLPVSAPFHSPLMRPAADNFSKELEKVAFNKPEITVIQNYQLFKAEGDTDAIKANLVKQIYNQVPWVQTIKEFDESGITHVLEIGPGQVLCGFNKRINKEMQAMSVNSVESLHSAMELTGTL